MSFAPPIFTLAFVYSFFIFSSLPVTILKACWAPFAFLSPACSFSICDSKNPAEPVQPGIKKLLLYVPVALPFLYCEPELTCQVSAAAVPAKPAPITLAVAIAARIAFTLVFGVENS